MSNQSNNYSTPFVSLTDMWYACLSHWKWFVISVLIALTLGYIYVKKTAPIYKRSMSVLLMNCGGDSPSAEINLEELGLQRPNTNLNNEIEMFRSPFIMNQVVESLHLDVQYSAPGRFYNKVLYGSETPIEVKFSDVSASNKSFTVAISKDSSIILSGFAGTEKGFAIKARLGQTFDTPCGEITVFPKPTYDYLCDVVKKVVVDKMQVSSVSNSILSRLTVETKTERSSVVNISLVDQSIARADEILNRLLVIYNDNWIKTQNRIAENTSHFLNERVHDLGVELGAIDDSIAWYKGKHLIPTVGTVQDMYVKNNNEVNQSIQEYTTQLALLSYMRNYLVNNMNSNRMLPAEVGIENLSVADQITSYNTLQMQRNEYVAYGGEAHPRVRDLDKQLSIYRKSIIESIDQASRSLRTQLGSLQKQAGKTAGQIANSTQQEKHLLTSSRQQTVKEQLYLFLLQEKEKTDISLKHNTSNTRIIQEASGLPFPIAPQKARIMIMALIVGLAIPFVIIFVIKITDTKIRSRKDVEMLSAPYLGDIAQAAGSEKVSFFNKLFKRNKKKSIKILVEKNSRDVFNESLRVVRTNLEFMTHGEKERKVFLVTSMHPDSGKSFIVANLGSSLSFVGKNVLIIDLDMRRCTISKLNKRSTGISNYLCHTIQNIDDIIVRNGIMQGVDLIPVGSLPPNPTELLHDSRLKDLIEKMREKYDCVFIDCPPIDLVADVDLIKDQADITLFVVRAGLTDRSMLSDFEKLYEDQRYKNVCLILNGTDSNNSYARHRYGKGYGYSYNYAEEDK